MQDDYLEWKREGRLVNDGFNVKLLSCHGPLDAREPAHIFATPACTYRIPLHADSE